MLYAIYGGHVEGYEQGQNPLIYLITTAQTVSDFGYDRYPKKGRYTACVKVIDVFGCDTSITVEVNI